MLINETSTKTFVNTTKTMIAERFLRLQTLYSNAMHDVVKVYDQLLDKEAVLKIIKNPEQKNLLLKEFKTLMKLHHPNIIRGYEFYQDSDLIFYSMEYVKSSFKSTHFKFYIDGILKTFRYLHRHHLLYQDIKLNNFLFHEQHVTLIDFSKAKQAKDFKAFREENNLVAKFLIQLMNYHLKIDFLGNPKAVEHLITKQNINQLIDMFYRKSHNEI